MFVKSHPRLLVCVVSLFVLLSACALTDMFGVTSAPATIPATLQPQVPVQVHPLGEATAPITVEEYVDFQCPPCGAFARGALKEIKEKYVKTGQVKLILRHYAFIGEESIRAAEASECANDQGKFWEYVDLLFQNQAGENKGAFADAQLLSLAQQLGLKAEQFKTCLADHQHLAEVQASIDEGTSRGINSVPTLFINGQMVRGAVNLEKFEEYLTPNLK